VSPLPWGNTLRTWEGVTAVIKGGAWTTTALASAFVPVDRTGANERDDDELLFGLYASRAPAGKGSAPGLDLYALGNTREQVAGGTANGTAGDSERLTLGARSWGPLRSSFDYEVEGAYQGGEVGSEDVNAGFVAANLGWKPAGHACRPRLWVGADWASGDGSSGGRVGTFDQLYPLGHAFLGFMDFIGRQNITSAETGVSTQPMDRLTLRLSWHEFWLEDKDDALYNAGGGVLRAPGSFESSHVGDEVDLLAKWKQDAHTELYAGYSHFFPGAALRDSGPAQDVDFVYVGLSFTF
jgi:hypothetical protein